MKKIITNLILIVAVSIILIACDGNPQRTDMLGVSPNILIDQNGNHWIVQHHLGALYTVDFLGDSTFKLNKPIQK